MTRRTLTNKPLVEAIFELRWELQEREHGMKVDPHYKILIGRVYDRLKDQYPFHEELPSADIPDEMAAYMVQHRFRTGEGEWPLVQLGPGILTLNETDRYQWEDFENNVGLALNALFESHHDSQSVRIQGVRLRYIDAIDFDYAATDIFGFLEEHLKTAVQVAPPLFEGTGVGQVPSGLDLRFCFPSAKPKGSVHLRLARGTRRGVDALVWETMAESLGTDAPRVREEVSGWVGEAHELTVYGCFFKMIDEELLRRFK